MISKPKINFFKISSIASLARWHSSMIWSSIISFNGFEKVNLEFCKLRDGLTKYTNKENWINEIIEII